MSISMREMLEAGVHFGHQTRFWNPKMAPYIFGHRNKIHIVNLEKTLPLFEEAAKFVRQLSANRGTILMVGTKRQSRDIVAQEARRAGVPFVDQRWLRCIAPSNANQTLQVRQPVTGGMGFHAPVARVFCGNEQLSP